MEEKLDHQEENLKRLKLECRPKDLRIGEFKSLMNARKRGDNQKTELPRLSVINEQQKESSDESSMNITVDCNGRTLDCNGDTVDSYEDELNKLRQENEHFRLVIARLETENSKMSELRVEAIGYQATGIEIVT